MRPILATYVGITLFLGLVPAALAGTVHVANNGADSAVCGAVEAPCRSITQAIHNAQPGDHVLVGPGRYREERGAPGCGCFLAVNKSVVLRSTDGAASTIIDARDVVVATNVLIIADGSEFGQSAQGFTVTNAHAFGGMGIAVDARNVKVRGNQVIADN